MNLHSKLLSILLCLWIFPLTTEASKPNILMIAVDDLRPMLGCYGDTDIQSPHIDQLAAQGTLFERAYCQYAKCGTSRLSLLTGLRPDSIGVFSNNTRDLEAFRKRRPDVKAIGEWFKENGYYTQSFGKLYHDGWDNPKDWSVPSNPGRDREMWEVVDEKNPTGPTIIAERLNCPVLQSPDVPDDHLYAGRMTNQAIEALANKPQKPYFLAVGYRRPHLPFIAPKKYYDLYQPKLSWLAADPIPPTGVSYLSWFNSDGYGGSARKIGLTMPNPPSRDEAIAWNGYEMRSYLGVPSQGPIPETRQLELIHAYKACVSYVDAQIGRLIEKIDLSDTIVILWSDHGWHLGEKSAWGKMSNYEFSTRVPLIFAGPGIEIGRKDDLVELVDIYPTLCDLSSIPKPAHLEGDSFLMGALRGETQYFQSRQAISQYSRYKGKYQGISIRSSEGHYLVWYDKNKKIVSEEFYDTDSDPGETENLFPNLSHERKTKLRKEANL